MVAEMIKQFLITPEEGKRLIAKSMLKIPEIQHTLENGTIVIIAGTTNGYVAEEMLHYIGQAEGFSRAYFYRGVVLPPQKPGKKTEKRPPLYDVIIEKGRWVREKTIFDVVDSLKQGDIIIKGANAVNPLQNMAGILIGDPKCGTIGASWQAVIGRRVSLYIPVGLEKRVYGDINEICNSLSHAAGPRFMPVSGNIVTETEAIQLLTGARAALVAAGGVCGAEGSIFLAVSGEEKAVEETAGLLKIIREQVFGV